MDQPLEIYDKLKDVLEKPRKVSMFTHPTPDPDAIGSFMGMAWLFSHYGWESYGFYTGEIAHPQNMAVVNLLDPGILPLEEYVKNQDNYDFRVLLDTVPSNAGIDKKTKFDLVIDHHKDPTNGDCGLLINLNAGSCCGTIFNIIEKLGLSFDDSDGDKRVVTALMAGISTDTDALMSEETSEYEFKAWQKLFDLRDSEALKKIINYKRPKFWVTAEAEAVQSTVVKDGVAVVGLGIIPAKHRDVIADMASRLVTWEEVHTGVVFALVEGERVEGSVRSTNVSVIVPDLCKKLGGKHGQGGGRRGKGAYRYELAGASVDDEDDDETRMKMWELYQDKETKRIRRILST